MEKLKTNTLRTLFEPFCRYLNNNLGSASVFNVKINSVCLEQNVANLGNFHRSFQNKMARKSSNFGNKLQIMVGIGKECGLRLILTC